MAELVEERSAVMGVRRKGGHELRRILADLRKRIEGGGCCCRRFCCCGGFLLWLVAAALASAVFVCCCQWGVAVRAPVLPSQSQDKRRRQTARSEGTPPGQLFAREGAGGA